MNTILNVIIHLPHWILWTVAIFGSSAGIIIYVIWRDTHYYEQWRKGESARRLARRHENPFDPDSR